MDFDIYFLPWIVVQCSFIYFVAQIVPALDTGCSFRRFPCPSDVLHQCGFAFLLFFKILPAMTRYNSTLISYILLYFSKTIIKQYSLHDLIFEK